MRSVERLSVVGVYIAGTGGQQQLMDKMTIADALAASSGLTRKVLKYSTIFKEVMDRAKQRPLTDDDWSPIAALMDESRFKRTGVAMEEMDWPTYRAFLTQYAGSADWHGYFRRASEAGDRVILELEEHSTAGNATDVANTATIYDFDTEHRLIELRVYIQSKHFSTP